MARRKNVKRIDPRYFLHETVNRGEELDQVMNEEEKDEEGYERPLEAELAEEKDDDWIQDAEADIERRGTEGVCTGEKFGSDSCPPGSKRYNLAKTFRKMAKKRKKD